MSPDSSQIAQFLKSMSPEAFAALGGPSLTYIRAVDVDGHTAYAMHSADGRAIAIFDRRETALVAARQHELEPVSVH